MHLNQTQPRRTDGGRQERALRVRHLQACRGCASSDQKHGARPTTPGSQGQRHTPVLQPAPKAEPGGGGGDAGGALTYTRCKLPSPCCHKQRSQASTNHRTLITAPRMEATLLTSAVHARPLVHTVNTSTTSAKTAQANQAPWI